MTEVVEKITASRKKRLTNKEIKDFAIWALTNKVYDKYTSGRIRQLYLQEKNVDLSVCTIVAQRRRWKLINGKVYDVNKPWTMPNDGKT